MAFDEKKMALIANGNNKKAYFYGSSVDAMSAILAANYFDAFAAQLDVGDTIIVHDSADLVAIVRVSDITAGVVTLSYTTGWLQQAKINDPAGGATQDAEARTAINAIIDALEAHGISSAA